MSVSDEFFNQPSSGEEQVIKEEEGVSEKT
jgi:hypothetical protein